MTHLGLREFRHGLSALGDGMLRQLTGQNQANSGLDVPTAQSLAFLHPAELGRLIGDLVEGIRHEVVHDGDSLLRDARVRMNLLEHLEDVRLERLRRTAALDDVGRRLGSGLLHHCE